MKNQQKQEKIQKEQIIVNGQLFEWHFNANLISNKCINNQFNLFLLYSDKSVAKMF